MDLLKLSATETTKVMLRDPKTGNQLLDGKSQVSITITSYDRDKVIDEARSQKIEKDAIKEEKGYISAERDRHFNARIYASCIVSWSGIDGECNFDNAYALFYPESMGWLRVQIDDALTAHTNKLKK